MNIRRLRKALDWSQEQLAFEAGLHRTYISGIERGVRNVGLDNVGAIAKALGVKPFELLLPAIDNLKPKQKKLPRLSQG